MSIFGKGIIPCFVRIYQASQTAIRYQNVGQMLPKLGFEEKEENPKLLFYNNLGFSFCGATRTLFSLFYLITKIKRNKKYIEI